MRDLRRGQYGRIRVSRLARLGVAGTAALGEVPAMSENWTPSDPAEMLMQDEELGRAVATYWHADDGDMPEAEYQLFAVIADRIGQAYDDGFALGVQAAEQEVGP